MRAALAWWSAATFAVMWVAFVIVFVTDPDGFDTADEWLDDRPVVVRVVLWVAFLPVGVGLKTWTSTSPAVRLVGVALLVVWTVASAASVARLIAG